jgi:toxin ParE1/3/4
MKAYRLSRLALEVLDAIWLNLAVRASEPIANETIDSITGRFALLSRMPRAGMLRGELGPEVRSFPVGNYIISYTLPKGRKPLLISRVLHAKRDQIRVLRSGAG